MGPSDGGAPAPGAEGLFGRDAPWRHPGRGLLARALDRVANSRRLRAIGGWAPSFSLRSDVTDAFYLNYLVEAARLEGVVPSAFERERLGPGGRWAILTFLVFRHGHFGPSFLGPLRRLLPSPVQLNVRTHVRDPKTAKQGVYFLTTAVDSTLIALAARLLSAHAPMHVFERAELRSLEAAWRIHLVPGHGSAPDLEATLLPTVDRRLPLPWSDCFESWGALLAGCVPQERALAWQPERSRVARLDVRLGAELASCEPLEGDVRSRLAASLAGESAPLCFRVPRLAVRSLREEHDPR